MIHTMVLKITNRCNWNCQYCDNRDNQDVDINKLIIYINKLQNLNSNITIALSGGEPGILSESYLYQLFSVTKHKCEVATNGLFFKNNYHQTFSNHIKEFWYHVTPEIINDNTVYDIIDTLIPVQYIFVIHNRNLRHVISFLKRNKHITFSPRFYIGCDMKYILTQSDIATLYYEGICDMNITDEYKERIKHFSNIDNYRNMIASQEYCNTITYMPRIDLIKDIIYRCCAGVSNDIDQVLLNDIHLRVLIKDSMFLCKHKTNYVCSSCFNGAWNCRLKI